MRRVGIDFLEERATPAWMWWTTGGLVFVAVCLLAFARHLEAEVVNLRQQVVLAQGREATPLVPQAAALQPKPHEASARELLAEHTMPWPRILDALEAVEVQGVQVISLDIATRDAVVRLEVRFSDYAQLTKYIELLNVEAGGASWTLRQASSKPGGESKALIDRTGR